jgi:hypothetical protein
MLRILALASALLLALAAPAQTPPCFATNDFTVAVSTSVSGYGFAGENARAWKISPVTSSLIQSGQFFTRNNTLSGSIFMSMEIWSDNNGTPSARLGGGSWRIVNSRPFAWQGANFDSPVALSGGSSYWVVWVEPGFSNFPVEPGGAVVLPRVTRSGTSWVAGTAEAPKIRLFCGLLDDLYSVPSGIGCASSSGKLPVIYTNEQPTIGNAGFQFEVSGIPAGGAVFVVFGFVAGWTPVAVPGLPVGCYQNTDVVSSALLFAGTGTTRGPTCAGYVSVPLALPASAAFVGLSLAAQALALDAASTAALPFAGSNAQRVTLY